MEITYKKKGRHRAGWGGASTTGMATLTSPEAPHCSFPLPCPLGAFAPLTTPSWSTLFPSVTPQALVGFLLLCPLIPLSSFDGASPSVFNFRISQGFPGGASGKEPACQRRRHKRHGLDPWVRKIPWRRALNPLLYSCLNPMGKGAWWAAIHRVPELDTTEPT